MTSLFEIVGQYFAEDEWPVDIIDTTVFRTRFRGETGQWVCNGWIREEDKQFVFYSMCPITVPESRLGDAMEFTTRANFGMILGNFELDVSDGEIRYKTSIDVEGGELTVGLCRQVVVSNVMMMDRYLPGVLAVISGARTPAQAIAELESN
jgi:hypothetical protein